MASWILPEMIAKLLPIDKPAPIMPKKFPKMLSGISQKSSLLCPELANYASIF